MKAIAKNRNFTLGTAEQDRVVTAYGKLIGNAPVILKQYSMR
ncbi:hypothetical protein ACT7DL_30515 [Bacillus paranthracis]